MNYSLLIFTDMTAFRDTLSYSLPMEQLLVPGAYFQVTGKTWSHGYADTVTGILSTVYQNPKQAERVSPCLFISQICSSCLRTKSSNRSRQRSRSGFSAVAIQLCRNALYRSLCTCRPSTTLNRQSMLMCGKETHKFNWQYPTIPVSITQVKKHF